MNLNEALSQVQRVYFCTTGEWLKTMPGLEEEMIASGKPTNTLFRAARLMGFEGTANPFRHHMLGECSCPRLTKH